MARNGAHSVVRNAGRGSLADPGGVGEERVEAAVAPLDAVSKICEKYNVCTYVVQVDVDASKVVQHEVSYRIGALDRVRVAVKCFEEPRIPAEVSRGTHAEF